LSSRPTDVKCPACDRTLIELVVGSVRLDVCQGGCGGVWFDATELAKVNQDIPSGTEPLTEVSQTALLNLDEQRTRKCIRCQNVKLERKLFSLGSGVIMDCCPHCGGLWLDHGELESIRAETNPVRRPAHHVVARPAPKPKTIPINFGVIQQVQRLRVSRY